MDYKEGDNAIDLDRLERQCFYLQEEIQNFDSDDAVQEIRA